MTSIRQFAKPGRTFWALCAVLALLFVVLPSGTAQGGQGNGKISDEVEEKLRGAGSDDMIPVIIQTVDDPSALHFTRLHGRGGVVKGRYASIHGYSAQMPASQIEDFSDDPEVTHISFDSPVRAHMDVAYPAVKADVAFVASGGLDGRGVGVAVIDTGVQGHDDLLRSTGLGPVEVEIVGHETGLADYYGHGTHVAGIINGNGADSSDKWSFRTFKGIAPGARLISIRALYPDGTGYTSDILASIDWAIANRATYNIRVINLSLGHPIFESYTTDPLCRSVRAAYNAGLVVVVAAGNDGRVGSGFGTITTPGNEPSAVTVGAMDDGNTVTTTDDVLAAFSSKGPTLIDHVVKPDLVAPGTRIVSLRATGSYLDTNYHNWVLKLGDYKYDNSVSNHDGTYYELSGTSMSAPLVAGTAALMLQKEPGLNAATVKARLMASATKDNRLVFETGAGYLNVDAALRQSGYATSAMSPLSVVGSDNYVYVQDLSLIWGVDWQQSIIWGLSKETAYGYSLTNVSGSSVAPSGYVWGVHPKSLVENTQITASGLIWGVDACSLIWSGSSVDAQGAVWGGKGGH